MIHISSEQEKQFDEISESLSRGKWRDVASKSGSLFDDIIKSIHRRILENKKLSQLERIFWGAKNEKPKLPSFAKMTLGQRLHVFREYDLFTVYENSVGEDLSLLKHFDWDKILKIRNNSVHKLDVPIEQKDALFMSSSLRLLALQVTDWKPNSTAKLGDRFVGSIPFKIALVVIGLVIVVGAWKAVPLARKARILQTEYGREIAEILKEQENYSLAIWLAQGDKSIENRDRFLYELYIDEAEKISISDPLGAYHYYDRALSCVDKAFELDRTREWQRDILLNAQDALLEKMTESDRVRAKYGNVQAVYRNLTR